MAFLAVPGPFDFALSTERFRAFGVDRASLWHEGGLHCVVGSRALRIEAAPGGVDAGAIVAPLAGFRPPMIPDPFEMLVGAITAQQVSLVSATAIRNRIIERFGARAGEAWAFPARERLARAGEEELHALGLTRRKAEYVVGLARSELDLDALAALPDDEVKARLTAVRGLGEWTADWFLARHLARPHAWPWGDLALRKVVEALYRGLDVRDARDRFHPFENLSAHYLLLSQRIP